MDKETSLKISKLAKTLKELHVAGTTEEAYAQARKIIEEGRSEEKSIGQLFKEHGLFDDERSLRGEMEKLREEQDNEKADELELQRELKAIEKELESREEELDIVEKNAEKVNELAAKMKRKPVYQHLEPEPDEPVYEAGISEAEHESELEEE